jgi:hypothetical protein
MKYFTAELIAQGQSQEEQVLEEHERRWEETGARYIAYLDTVRPEFPSGLRKIDQSFYLHDAEVLGMGQHGRTFILVLRLDTPPHSLLVFTYDLVAEPVIEREASPSLCRFSDTNVLWQYNEIERIPGEPVTWKESILFSNGWELQLPFRDVQFQEVQALLPSVHNGCNGTSASAASSSAK